MSHKAHKETQRLDWRGFSSAILVGSHKDNKEHKGWIGEDSPWRFWLAPTKTTKNTKVRFE